MLQTYKEEDRNRMHKTIHGTMIQICKGCRDSGGKRRELNVTTE